MVPGKSRWKYQCSENEGEDPFFNNITGRFGKHYAKPSLLGKLAEWVLKDHSQCPCSVLSWKQSSMSGMYAC